MPARRSSGLALLSFLAGCYHPELSDRGPPGGCGGPGVLYDDFQVFSAAWETAAAGASVSVGGGELVFESDGSTGGAVQMVMKDRTDLRDSALTVEVLEVPVDTGSTWLDVVVAQRPTENDVRFSANGSSLSAESWTNGAWARVKGDPWDPRDRFWRILESDGMISWETSENGSDFTPVTGIPAPDWLEFAEVRILFVADVGPPVVARLGSVNRSPPDPWCAIDKLADDFERSELGERWTTEVGDFCSFAVTDGQLNVVRINGNSGECRIRSSSRYDLRDSHVHAETIGLFLEAGSVAFLRAGPNDQDYVGFGVSDGELRAEVATGAIPNVMRTARYDPATHRFLRIGEAGGTFNWSVSEDAVTWLPFHDQVASIDPSSVHVRLGLSFVALAAFSDYAGFDRVNLP